MFFRHPSRRALQEWLDRGDNESVDRHVADCQRCAAVIEELTAEDEAALSDALAVAFAPPVDLSDRLQQRVAARLDSRVVLSVMSDLFGAGLETSRLLLLEEDSNE
ncbi:MAG: hypothetical protein AAF547_11830 [Actinomycetota bacterium]